jgi:hypothetical protein
MSTDTAHPTPAILIPAGRDLPPEIQALIARLSEPFPLDELRVRPGQVRRDGTAAQVLPYAEWWGSYQPRLDSVLGRANWRIRLIPWGTDSIIARMTVFGGLIERDSTGSSKESFEGGQDAEAQAMKRVCARAVGLGLYLYHLPEVWGRGERDGKRFFFADGEEERCLHELYRRAGLTAIPHSGSQFRRGRPRSTQSLARLTPVCTRRPAVRRPPASASPRPVPRSRRRSGRSDSATGHVAARPPPRHRPPASSPGQGSPASGSARPSPASSPRPSATASSPRRSTASARSRPDSAACRV